MFKRKEKTPTSADSRTSTAGRRHRPGRYLRRLCRIVIYVLALGMAFQLLLIFTPLSQHLQSWLDVTEPPREADVIVCLGGRDLRQVWAADLFRQQFAPLIIVSNRPGAAEVMKAQIVQAGVPPENILVDNQSYRTADHPDKIAALPGIDRETQTFLIVTDKEHSRRARACFRHGGYRNLSVYAGRSTATGCGPEKPYDWKYWVLHVPWLAYEYAALAQYWWQGQI